MGGQDVKMDKWRKELRWEKGVKRGREERQGRKGRTKERKVRGKVDEDEGGELLLPLTGGREGSLGELH